MMLLIGDIVEVRLKADGFEDTIVIGEITGVRSDTINRDNEFFNIGTMPHWFSTIHSEITKLVDRG